MKQQHGNSKAAAGRPHPRLGPGSRREAGNGKSMDFGVRWQAQRDTAFWAHVEQFKVMGHLKASAPVAFPPVFISPQKPPILTLFNLIQRYYRPIFFGRKDHPAKNLHPFGANIHAALFKKAP